MLYIGIDLGTSAVKLLLMDADGKIKKIASRTYDLSFPHPGWSEQNPADWYEQSIDGLKELLAECDKSRVAGISFDTAVFLNLSPDHISPTEHADFDEYRACKAALFAQCGKAVGNLDDPNWPLMRARTRPGCAVSTFGLGDGADIRGYGIRPVRGNGRVLRRRHYGAFLFLHARGLQCV